MRKNLQKKMENEMNQMTRVYCWLLYAREKKRWKAISHITVVTLPHIWNVRKFWFFNAERTEHSFFGFLYANSMEKRSLFNFS